MLGLASCDSTDDPKMTLPEDKTFVLNAPAFADQYYELQEGNSFMLTCSQPAYGVAVAAQYSVEVALDDKFTAVETVASSDPGSAKIVIADKDLATALCKLHGFDAANYEDLPAAPVYFRAFCEIPNVEGSRCMSNTVSLNKVKFYHAVQGKRDIYLVGAISGWTTPDAGAAAHYENYKLTETEIGSNVYYGSFKFPAGESAFRFFTALNGWDDKEVQLGAGPEDMTDIPVEFNADGIYEGPYVCPGQSNWKINVPSEDNVNFTVDMNNKTVKFEVGGDINYDVYPCAWIIGNISGWKEPNKDNAEALANFRIFDTTGSGIFTNKPGEPFAYTEAPAFRIYTELGGWGEDGCDFCIGAKPNNDDNVDVTVPADGVVELTGVNGKGNWNFTNAPVPGTMEVSVDLNAKKITLTFKAAAAD